MQADNFAIEITIDHWFQSASLIPYYQPCAMLGGLVRDAADLE